MGPVESQLDCLVLKIKSRVIKSYFYPFRSWNAKKAKPRENEVHIQSVTYNPFFQISSLPLLL
jgi:hypothetical protein